MFYPGLLLRFGVTLELTGWSLLTVAFGLSAALLQRSTSWAGHAVARIHVEIVRNTPDAGTALSGLFRWRRS